MSGIKDNKINSTDTQGKKVADVPGDSLSGTVLENKQVFDKLTEVVITKYNSALDYLYSKNIDSGVTSTTATTTANGLMSSADKSKLNGIASGANNYTHPTYTARTGKPTANQTPAFGGTATVSQITSDSTGHVTNATDRTITIPNATATTSANGLMSSTDKTKLNALCDFDSLFSVEAVSIGLMGGGTYSGTKSISKSNYYPLGICGWYTSTGLGNARILVNTLYLSSQSVGSGVITFNTKNVGTSEQTSESLVARVLWIKAAV